VTARLWTILERVDAMSATSDDRVATALFGAD
jgi:hypothetical protein